MKAIIAKAVRQILFIAGGALGAKSAGSESDIEAITSAIMVIASLGWSWWNEVKERKAAAKTAATVGALALLVSAWGCASVAPGNSALVVNVERGQAVAAQSFDTVLKVDNANRPFFRTNTPAFHRFCEDLRRPVTLGTNQWPRVIAAQVSVQDLKTAYKLNRTNESALAAAFLDLQRLSDEANLWILTLATNSIR